MLVGNGHSVAGVYSAAIAIAVLILAVRYMRRPVRESLPGFPDRPPRSPVLVAMGALIVAAVVLLIALDSFKRGNSVLFGVGLLATGLCTLFFIAGVRVWRMYHSGNGDPKDSS